MPSLTSPNSNGSAAGAPQKKRFEIPALTFNFGSLTEGTDIPPPLPSPIQEVPTPPKTPTKTETAAAKSDVNDAGNGHAAPAETSPKSDVTASTHGGVKRSAEEGPASPTLSNRGSLRRLLSKSLLNSSYNEDQAQPASSGLSRPSSRLSGAIGDERKSKRSSGWFRRLRTNDTNTVANKRLSSYEEVNTVPKEPAGPPPPMIPELSALKSKIDTSMGDDLFKEIK